MSVPALVDLAPPAALEKIFRGILRGRNPEFPRDLLVIDIETTDLDPWAGEIWQLGYYSVMGGGTMPGCEQGCSIWLQTEPAQLARNTFEITRRLADRGVTDADPVSVEFAKECEAFAAEVNGQGLDRVEAFRLYYESIEDARSVGGMIAGHNLVAFDIPYLEYSVAKHVAALRFPKTDILDTGMIIKAAQLDEAPRESESPLAFYRRVSAIRARGVKYSLEGFCVPVMRLDSRFGIQTANAHSAGYDCLMTALSLSCLLEAVTGVPAEDMPPAKALASKGV